MMLYALATIVPTCAVTVRRLHDADYSGWWRLCRMRAKRCCLRCFA